MKFKKRKFYIWSLRNKTTARFVLKLGPHYLLLNMITVVLLLCFARLSQDVYWTLIGLSIYPCVIAVLPYYSFVIRAQRVLINNADQYTKFQRKKIESLLPFLTKLSLGLLILVPLFTSVVMTHKLSTVAINLKEKYRLALIEKKP